MDFKIVGKNKIITIDLYDFWITFQDLYISKSNPNSRDLRNDEGQKISSELGLRFLDYYTDGVPYFKFEIIDEKKWMLTRIEYGF